MNLHYENGFLVPVSALHKVSKTKSALKNIFSITHIGDLVWAGKSDHTPFIGRTEYYLSWWFV